MDSALANLDNAKAIIRDAIARCEASGHGTSSTPPTMPAPQDLPGHNSPPSSSTPIVPMPNPQDMPGHNSPPASDASPEAPPEPVTPVQSWTVEGGAFGGLEGLPAALSVGGDGSVAITQLSDGSFDITMGLTGNVSGGLAGNGIEGGRGGAVTYRVTPEELAYLREQGIPIPDGIIPPGTDSSNVNANPFDNITSVEATSYAELALHDFDIPDAAQTAAQDFFNTDLPDGVSAAAGGETGFEARQNQNGEWEFVQKASVNGSYDIEEHEQSAGGLGGFISDFTPVDLNGTTITGEKVDYEVERVFNTETGQTETRVIETRTSLEAEGSQAGIDIQISPVPIPDFVPGSEHIPSIEHTFAEESSGTTTTVTTTTVYDNSGNVVSSDESTSNGTFTQGEGNLVVIGADGQSTHEVYS